MRPQRQAVLVCGNRIRRNDIIENTKLISRLMTVLLKFQFGRTNQTNIANTRTVGAFKLKYCNDKNNNHSGSVCKLLQPECAGM